jgi:hypothetical protein
MEKIKFIFYRYKQFQVSFGNADVSSFNAILAISCLLALYYFDLIFVISLFSKKIDFLFYMNFVYVIMIGSFIFLYFLLVFNKKGVKIYKHYNKLPQKKNSAFAILFAVIPFSLFFICLILGYLINNGYI